MVEVILSFDICHEINFNYKTDIIFHEENPPHENGMTIAAFDAKSNQTGFETYYSIGGGFITTAHELRHGNIPHGSRIHAFLTSAARARCFVPGPGSHLHGIGIDMNKLFSEQTRHRAEELAISNRVQFIHNDAAGYVAEEKYDVAACVGATWIAGRFAGMVELLGQSLKPGGIMLIGEPYWRQLPVTDEIAQACGVSSRADFLTLPGLVGALDGLGYDVVEMVLADQEDWDRYEVAKWLTMRRWLQANPDDDFTAEVRAELNISPKRHVTYAREYFGWGVFALTAR